MKYETRIALSYGLVLLIAVTLVIACVLASMVEPAPMAEQADPMLTAYIDSAMAAPESAEGFSALRIDASPDGRVLCIRSLRPEGMQCYVRVDEVEEDDTGSMWSLSRLP
jgi:hypothetical protein